MLVGINKDFRFFASEADAREARRSCTIGELSKALTEIVNLLNPALGSFDTRLHMVQRAVSEAEVALACHKTVIADAEADRG